MKDNTVNALMKADMGDTISYSAGNYMVGGNSISGSSWDACWHQWYPQIYSYPIYTNIVQEKPNAFELAFKIVTKMLEKKIIERLTVKQLIETVNEIAKLV